MSIYTTLVLSLLAIGYRGYILTLVWSWFMVTTFSLPPIQLASAIGVMCVHDMLRPSGLKLHSLRVALSETESPTRAEEWTLAAVNYVVLPTGALGIAALARWLQ